MSVATLDKSYQKKAAEYNLARIGGPLNYYGAHYQSTKEGFKGGFIDGASIGAFLGLGNAVFYRKVGKIP